MIGNDIIDLRVANLKNNWQRERYLGKIFTANELKVIHNAEDKSLVIWYFWSMKEAVYKIISRKNQQRFFAPKSFDCQLGIDLSSELWERKVFSKVNTTQFVPKNSLPKSDICIYKNQVFQTQTFQSKNQLHTLAKTLDISFQNIHHYLFKIPKSNYATQSKITHQQLITQYAKFTRISKMNLSIKKNELGIPNLYFKNKRLPVLISISHHGNWGGFAIKF